MKAGITANIRQNDSQLITGAILQGQLLAMVNELGAGYQFMGVATPVTDPGTPDEKVFYIASEAGTYTNFGGIIVAEGEVAILKYDGTWDKEVTGAANADVLEGLREVVGFSENYTRSLEVSTSTQRFQFLLSKSALSGTFRVIFSGGSTSAFQLKIALYRDNTAAGNLIYESDYFKFNEILEYSGTDSFNLVVFSIYANQVVTAGEAVFDIKTGLVASVEKNKMDISEGISDVTSKNRNLMIYTKGYILSGSAQWDENGIIISSGVRWADGVAGTLTRSNWDENILEYKRDVVTHSDSPAFTVQYDRTYNDMGENIREIITLI